MQNPQITYGCQEGRHGTPDRNWDPDIFSWGEGCYGVSKAMDGYMRPCPCECHGENTEPDRCEPWLISLRGVVSIR